jgi:hypothetical protein
VAIVYTYEESEMKSRLYAVVQEVCDEIQDTAGRARIVVRAGDHAAYLDDGDDEDFFAGGATGGKAGGAGSQALFDRSAGMREKTAAERLKERDGNGVAQGKPSGWFGSLFGW